MTKEILLALTLLLPLHGAALDRPNFVLILADDIGYSDFGAYGGEIVTPNIDALAARGVRFSNFYAASSCAPTRAMLMTGVDNHLAGIGSMRELMPLSHRGKPGYKGVLDDNVRTIAELLRAIGYRTSVAGKWHLGTDVQNLPPARGFDYSVIQADSGSDNFEMRPYLPMTPEASWYEDGIRIKSLPENFYSSSFFVEQTIDFLKSTADSPQPFFAYVAFQANHTPLQAPTDALDAYRGKYTEGWAEVRQKRIDKLKEIGLIEDGVELAPGPEQAKWDALSSEQQYFEARRMQVYAAMATAMDTEIGKLVDWLRRSGQYENTVFIVMSDNGAVAREPYQIPAARKWLDARYHREVESLGEKGSWISAGKHWGLVSNTPLNGQKFSASEGGVRVPLIIAGGLNIEPGSINRNFTHVTDIAPTILAMAGWKTDDALSGTQTISGYSLVPSLDNKVGVEVFERGPVGYEFSGNAALFVNNYKLARNLPPHGDGNWQLFDLSVDIGETQDISAEKPALFRQMINDYETYASHTRVLPMPSNYSLSRQATINTLLFFYLPRYLPYLFIALLLSVAGVMLWRRRSRQTR